MADVDWDAVAAEYRPLLDRITTSSEFADVLWEVFGELGTSHAYVMVPGGEPTPITDSELARRGPGADGDGWRIGRVVRGESSDPRARSPLAAPGVGLAAGDLLLAIDGRPVGPGRAGPAAGRHRGQAGRARGRRRRRQPSPQRRGRAARQRPRLRYQDWVSRKRAAVRELGDGQVGYLHVPDMVSEGWADFHRDLRSEMLCDALIVDVRGNTGGHTSQLVVEKLARRVIGWDVAARARRRPPTPRTRRAAPWWRSPTSARDPTATSSRRRSRFSASAR